MQKFIELNDYLIRSTGPDKIRLSAKNWTKTLRKIDSFSTQVHLPIRRRKVDFSVFMNSPLNLDYVVRLNHLHISYILKEKTYFYRTLVYIRKNVNNIIYLNFYDQPGEAAIKVNGHSEIEVLIHQRLKGFLLTLN